MPQISWNEVKDRAIRFSRDWAGAKREESDKQTFWNEFFDVFGMRRRNNTVLSPQSYELKKELTGSSILIPKSREDGLYLGMRLAQLWDVLNADGKRRQITLDDALALGAYINDVSPVYETSYR